MKLMLAMLEGEGERAKFCRGVEHLEVDALKLEKKIFWGKMEF